MKFKTLFAAACMAVASISGSANAAFSFNDVGTITPGSSGIPGFAAGPGAFLSYITGQIAPQTTVDFTFYLTGGHIDPVGFGQYSFNFNGDSYTGDHTSNASGNVIAQHVNVNAIPVPNALVLSSADIAAHNGTSFYSITNNSLSSVSFAVVLFGILKSGAILLATYSASAVSNVPLPAAAPLFGLAMAGLAWAGVKRKSVKA